MIKYPEEIKQDHINRKLTASKQRKKEQKHELEKIIDEQIMLMNVERLAGNVVKESFHKGALFGIHLILKCLKIEVANE